MKILKFTFLTLWGLCSASQGFAQNPTTAKLHLDNRVLGKAKEAIDKAIENPKHAEKAKTWLYKGMIYSAISTDQSGLFKTLDDGTLAISAYEALQKALQIEPDNKEVKKELDPQTGQLYGALANTALSFYNKAQVLTKDNKKEAADKSFAQCIKNADIASKVHPKDTIASYLIWAAASTSKDYEAFEKASETLIAHPSTKDKAVYCYYLAIYYYNEKKDNKKALEVAQKGMTFGGTPETQSLIVGILEKDGNADEAINAIKENLKKTPNDAGAYFNLGVLYERVKKYDEALAAYDKAISMGSNVDAMYNAGAIFYNRGAEIITTVGNMGMDEYNRKGKTEEAKASEEFKKALPYFEKLYLADSKNTRYLDILGQIYQQLKMKDKAEKVKKERDALGD